MKLYFIFNHLNAIVLAVWILFLTIVAIRFFRPAWVKNISFLKLSLIAFGLHVFFGLFITWGQYYVWANGGIFTQTFLNSPLPKEAPLPFFLEWIRAFFENNFGYFLHYVLGHFWLNIFILFFISGALYLLFKIWKSYRGGFMEQGPELMLVLMLISGYPGIRVLIPLGFFFAILLSFFYLFKRKSIENVNIEPAFIFATFFALLLPYYVVNVVNILLSYITLLFPSFVLVISL